jgi:hypothetical protein
VSEAVPPEIRREEDVLPRLLILRIILVTVTLGITLCIVAYLITWGREQALRPSLRFPERELAVPRAVADVRQELFHVVRRKPDLDAAGRAWLARYAWVDRGSGVVHIPIERAMDVVAGRSREARR